MTLEQFQHFADKQFNRIPLVREVLADLDTPLSCYQKLANGPYSYLLESVRGGEKWGRYSIIGLPCDTVLKVSGLHAQLEHKGAVIEEHQLEDPLAFVETFQSRYRVPEIEGLPLFNGGLVGYFAYDTIRYIEKSLAESSLPDPIGTPDILLMVSDELVVFDNLRGSLFIIVHEDPSKGGSYENAQARLDALEEKLASELIKSEKQNYDIPEESDFVSGFKEPDHAKAVEKVKEYILDGDVMQVVLSQRMEIDFEAPPLSLYRALRYLNPSPYLYFLNLDDFHIVGSSPEILARLENGEVSLRPIAGTRRRGRTEEEDKAMEAELLADPKEIAEHLMLIDLGRNDVGRVAKTGTVELSDKMIVERYSHVMHIVSNVKGQLQEGKTAMDVLKASLPAGTLSGAPKVRAMEIIEELEPVRRGIYGGAVGYLSWHGNMDTAIAIRTAVIKDKKLYIQAGGGLVADSIPKLEWKETMNKGRAIFKAVEMALKGLEPQS
jgi:anthranilate synthase component 1